MHSYVLFFVYIAIEYINPHFIIFYFLLKSCYFLFTLILVKILV